MKLVFNIGWGLERRLYDIKGFTPISNKLEDYLWAWNEVYKSCREDPGYVQYNHSHNKHMSNYVKDSYRKLK